MSRRVLFLETMFGDLRYSIRSLTRAPGLACALLLSVALGVGANASVLGFINGSVTRRLPLPDAERLVSVFGRSAEGTLGAVSLDRLEAIDPRREVFDLVGAVRESQGTVVVGDRSSIRTVGTVSADAAAILRLASGDGVVVSDRLRELEFEGRADVAGAAIRVDGRDTRVAGVAPSWLTGLFLGRAIDVWVPIASPAPADLERRSRTFWPLARLRDGVTAARAQDAVNAGRDPSEGFTVVPYTGATPEQVEGLGRVATLLPAAAAAVFLIGCANVASFLLSRGSARAREMSVRVALGASRGRLVRQLLVDSLVVAIAGGACGALLAFWTSQIVPALFFEQDAAELVFATDTGGMIAASLVCAAVTIACGLAPLLETRHVDPADVLRRESAGPSNAMRRVRAGLVVLQMACCCVLVVSALQLFTGFRGALKTAAAARLGTPILATVQAARGFQRRDLGLDYFRTVERTLRSLPGVSDAAWIGSLPGAEPSWTAVRIEPAEPRLRAVQLDIQPFTPPSLKFVSLPPVAGRLFSGRDTPDACRVAVVNAPAAEALFPRGAVGRVVEDPAGERVEIVGVVATKKTADNPAPERPAIFYSADQTPTPLGRTGPGTFRVPEAPASAGIVAANVVSAGFFDAMGLSLAAGALFEDRDDAACRVGVVNQEAAELYFGGAAVGGATIDESGRRTRIVGVVKSALLRASQRRPPPTLYTPLGQDFLARMTLILGSESADAAFLARVRRSVLAIEGGDPDRVVVATLDAYLSRTALASERIATVLAAAVAATALALGMLGLYGAMGDSARQRRREIAVRLALGAQGWRVMRQLLAEGLRLAGIGFVAGTVGAVFAARWLAGVAPGADAAPGWRWLAAPLVLAAAVALASIVPVRRALAVSPVAIMRDQ